MPVRARAQLDDHLFHLADHEHVFQEMDRGRCVDPSRFRQGPKIPTKPISRDSPAVDFERRKVGPAIAQVTRCGFRLPHATSPQLKLAQPHGSAQKLLNEPAIENAERPHDSTPSRALRQFARVGLSRFVPP